MNGRVERALLDELAGDVAGRAVTLEPVDDPLRPVGVAPHELALRVVERALVHGCAGEGVEVGRRADVVGVEVGHDDARHRPVDRGELGLPPLRRVGEPETGVDDRPAVRAGNEVAVHVPRPCRQRHRHAANAERELLHAPTLLVRCGHDPGSDP